jgi:thiamine-monophosphate kinase
MGLRAADLSYERVNFELRAPQELEREDAMPSLRDVGEGGLIRAIAAQAGTFPALALGIGDDAAAGTVTPGCSVLTTVDMLVEGVHFTLATSSARELGAKALAVNLSDIAAMGGKPLWAVVALALDPHTELAWVEQFYTGLLELAQATGTALAGGDTVRAAGSLTIAITVIGESARPLKRSSARAGDVVFMTGPAGLAAAGLWCLEHPLAPVDEADRAAARLAHARPQAHLAAGQALAASNQRVALLDNSDGLARSASLLAEASEVDVRLWSDCFPIETATHRVAAVAGVDALDWALAGGEDYGLVGCVARADWGPIAEILARTGCHATRVGEVVTGNGRAWVKSPTTAFVPLSESGFAHFGEGGGPAPKTPH